MHNKILQRSLWCVLLATMGFASAGCERLDQAQDQPGPDAIPAAYGKFVGATSDPTNPYVAALWFEQPDSTIVAVRVDIGRGRIGPRAAEFARK